MKDKENIKAMFDKFSTLSL